MREYVADRWEDGALVCFADGGGGERAVEDGARSADCGRCADGEARLSFPCPRVSRPEGRRVLLFEALGSPRAYVRVAGSIALPDGKAALILPPDEEKAAAVRSRFEKIFKKGT